MKGTIPPLQQEAPPFHRLALHRSLSLDDCMSTSGGMCISQSLFLCLSYLHLDTHSRISERGEVKIMRHQGLHHTTACFAGTHTSVLCRCHNSFALYKKGLATEAANYRPIFVNPLMYLAFMKIVCWKCAAKIMSSLDESQYAVKGRTMALSCMYQSSDRPPLALLDRPVKRSLIPIGLHCKHMRCTVRSALLTQKVPAVCTELPASRSHLHGCGADNSS